MTPTLPQTVGLLALSSGSPPSVLAPRSRNAMVRRGWIVPVSCSLTDAGRLALAGSPHLERAQRELEVLADMLAEGSTVTWPLRMPTRLADGRTLITEVGEHGDETTVWFTDAPDKPLVLSSVAAMALGQALTRASAITGQRCATPRDQRSRARGREEQARRMAHAVELERQRRMRR